MRADRTDAANDCAQVFSHIITDRFSETNLDAQNYANERIEFCTEEQLSRNVASSWTVYRRSIGKDKSRIVEEIDGKLCCSCHKDINSGEPCRHIQCVLCGSFRRQQFNDHWLRATDVEVCSRVITTNPTINPLIDTNDDKDDEEEASHLHDGVGIFVQDFAVITQLSQDTNIDNKEMGSSDSDLPGSDLPLHSMYAQTKMKKKKKPSSTEKYNSIRAEGELLANIASADSLEQFNKLLTLLLLRYVRANLQNKSGKELKEAASTYLDITEFDQNIDILPSSGMRTEG